MFVGRLIVLLGKYCQRLVIRVAVGYEPARSERNRHHATRWMNP